MSASAIKSPWYWASYSNLQHVKHNLIRHYLAGWFPKMALGATGFPRLLYVDTHAGCGRHQRGQPGSPLVALDALLNHGQCAQILRCAEVRYLLIERDAAARTALQGELSEIPRPHNVFVEAPEGDAFDILPQWMADRAQEPSGFGPAFVFVDPFGFSLPWDLLARILANPHVELFVNVMWRELDMAIGQARSGDGPNATAFTRTLDAMFAGSVWRDLDGDGDERADHCAELLTRAVGAQWGTHVRMMDNGRVRYFLLHLTNHDAGRDLMKECVWRSCPDGEFCASKSDNPQQMVLIRQEPNLEPLCVWVEGRLATGPKRWQELGTELRETLWLPKHLTDVIRGMRKSEALVAGDYVGSFGPASNPRLQLRPQPTLLDML
jgi:three-Cys-motif partner protein